MTAPRVKFPDPLNERTLDALLLECAGFPGLADLLIQSGDYMFGKLHGRQQAISDRRIDPEEVELICALKYGKTAIGVLNSGEPLDFRCEVARSLDDIVSFRANATRGRIGDIADGISLTMRYVTDVPRTLESLNLETDITDNLFPQYGLVLVVGTTGSGKSTILSSANRYRLESRTHDPVKIICYEDPIEYTYQALGQGTMPKVFQAEIGNGRHLREFAQAGPNAMRRGSDVIVLGEMRDRQSVEAGFELAMTGHCVYATLHVETPAQVIDRVVSFFPFEAQPSAASKLRSVLRMVIAQKQFPTRLGRTERVRSWCVFDREVTARLAELPYHQWERAISAVCADRKTDFETTAVEILRDRRISLETFCSIANFTKQEAITYCRERGLDASDLD
jgi:defect-in-organelle-trafficking protein DotB